MPKASNLFKDAVDSVFEIQEGPVEILKAVTRVHQYPPAKASGEQSGPFPCVQLELVRLDDEGNRLDEEPVKMEYSFGKLDKFHPGIAQSSDDDDPEDAGTEVDTEGNCIYSLDSESKLSKKCKWLFFTKSLEDAGFKPDVLVNGYMPDLIGTKLITKTVPGIKIPGQSYRKEPTILICDKIIMFPYDKRAKATKKAAGTAAPESQEAGSNHTENGVEHLAIETLQEIAKEMKGKTGVERKKLQTAFQARLMKNKVPVKQHKTAIDLVKSDDWLTRVSGEMEDSPLFGKFMVDGDQVSFAE